MHALILESFPVRREAAGSLPAVEILVADGAEILFYCDSDSTGTGTCHFGILPVASFHQGLTHPSLSWHKPQSLQGGANSRVRFWP